MKDQHLGSGMLTMPSANNSPHQPFDTTAQRTLGNFPDDTHLLYTQSRSTVHPITCENLFPKEYASEQHTNDHSNLYSLAPNDLYPAYPHQYAAGYTNNELATQLALFDALPSQANLHMGMTWDNVASSFEAGHHDRSKMLANSVCLLSAL